MKMIDLVDDLDSSAVDSCGRGTSKPSASAGVQA